MRNDSAQVHSLSEMTPAQRALAGAAACAVSFSTVLFLDACYVADEDLREFLKAFIEFFGWSLVLIFLVLAALRFANQKLTASGPRAAPAVRYVVAQAVATVVCTIGFIDALPTLWFKNGEVLFWSVIPLALSAGIATTCAKRLWIVWQASRHIKRETQRR